MRIVFLLRPWPVHGGGETVTIALANEMVKRGHEIFILYTRLETEKELPYIAPMINAILVPNAGFDEFTKKISKESIVTSNIFLLNFVKENNIDVVINQWWPVEALDKVRSLCVVVNCLHMEPFKTSEFENKRWRGKDIIFKLMGSSFYYYLSRKKSIRYIKHYFPYVDAYIFLAQSFLRQFVDFSGWKKNRPILDFCNNPLRFSNFIDSKDIDNKENIVLFVGRMYEGHKKVSKILNAWHSIEQKYNKSDWKLILVGDGPDRPLFEKIANDLCLKNYKFVGFCQPDEYYKKAKIFLMTSTHEGWGMTLVESQQNGVVPVVRDTFSAVHDIIEDNYNGRIIAPDDEETYVDAIIELMDNSEKLRMMALNGVKTCRNCTIEKVVDKWEMTLRNLLKNKNE